MEMAHLGIALDLAKVRVAGSNGLLKKFASSSLDLRSAHVIQEESLKEHPV
jgi:hypothetical protein